MKPVVGVSDAEMGTLADMDVGVVLFDAAGNVNYANPAACALLGESGSSRGEPGDCFAARFVRPDGSALPPQMHPAHEARVHRKPVRNVVLGVVHVDTRPEIWVLVAAVPHLNDAGQVTRVTCTLTDISAAHLALHDSEQVYHSVIRAMSEGVVIHEADGAIRMANPSAERVLGLTVDQLAGRTPMDPRWRLIKPDGQPVGQYDIPSEITQKTGQPCRGVILGVHRPSGELAWLNINTDPLKQTEASPPRGVVATFTDITAEREALLALEKSQSKMKRVLDAIPGVVYEYRLKPDGRDEFLFASGSVQEIMGLDAAQIVGEAGAAWAQVHPGDVAGLRAAARRSAAELTNFDHQFRMLRPDGRYRWVRAHAVLRPDADGVLFTGVMVDMDAQKALEEGLQRAQRREALGDLAAGVAHNFNNMLGAILPNLDLALQSAPVAIEPFLMDARNAARSAADLVRQMLNLGRADGDAPAQASDLVPLVRDALTICRRTFDRAIQIEETIDVERAFVLARPSDLHQIVLNLCLNARDALAGCDVQRIKVHLSMEGDGEAGKVLLRVSDTGVGMDAQTLSHIGEPFFTTKDPGKGTGLGLASTFSTLQQVGGSLTVASEPAQGTTFTVCLPRARSVAARPEAVTRGGRPVLKGRILVVDDEPLVRRVLVRQLRLAGMEVHEAESGDVAILILDAESGRLQRGLDAVILDLSLPGTPGPQVLGELKRRMPGVPVVILTGHVPEVVDLSQADLVLQKPLGALELLQSVYVLLSGKGEA